MFDAVEIQSRPCLGALSLQIEIAFGIYSNAVDFIKPNAPHAFRPFRLIRLSKRYLFQFPLTLALLVFHGPPAGLRRQQSFITRLSAIFGRLLVDRNLKYH